MKWLVEHLHPTFVDEEGCRGVIYLLIIEADSWFEAREAYVAKSLSPQQDPLSPNIRCTQVKGRK